MEIVISVIGALSAIVVATVGAFMANKNSNVLQIRKLKQEHYILFFEALHNNAAYNGEHNTLEKYTFYRDKLFVVGSEQVIKALVKYEDSGMGLNNPEHDELLTALIKAIRKDLKIKDKDFPSVYLKKANK